MTERPRPTVDGTEEQAPDPGRFARALTTSVAGRLVATALATVTFVVLARALAPAQFGVYVTAWTIVTLAAVLVEGGLVTHAVRELSLDPGRHRSVFASVLAIRLLLAGGAYAACVGFAVVAYGSADVVRTVALLALSVPVAAVVGSYRVIAEARLDAVRPNVVEVISKAASLAVALLLVRDGGQVTDAVTTALTGGAVALVLTVVAFRHDALPRLPGTAVRSGWTLLVASLPLTVAALLNVLYVRTDLLVIAGFRPDAEVGLYGVAVRVLDLVLMLEALVMSTAFPLLSAVSGDRARLQHRAQRLWAVALPVAVPVAVVGPLVADDLVELFAGTSYDGAGLALAVLAPAAALSLLNGWGGSLLIAAGLQRRTLWLNVSALLANVGLNVLVIPVYGYVGAAATTVACEVFILSAMLWLVRHHLGITPSISRPAVLAALVGAAVAITVACQAAGLGAGAAAVAAIGYAAGALATGLLPRPSRRPATS